MSKNNFFTNNPSASVSSNRILYTPSDFARTSLLHLQEIGTLKALKKHTSRREALSSFLFFFVIDGAGELEYGRKTYSLSKGSCVFIDCRHPYSHTTSDSLWTLRWCHFFGPMMTAVYEKYVDRGGKPVFVPSETEEFAEVLDLLYSIAGSDDFLRDMKLNEGLSRLCTLIMSESWHPENVSSVTSKRASVTPITEYLEEHYSERITLDDIAERFYINKYYLTRVFKEQTGVSISTYLQSVRITHAKQMLRFSDKTVQEIGQDCGFGEISYFTRVFKKVEGVPPAKYRNQW